MTAPVFILAGEPSGDRLAASLMKAVNDRFGQQSWIGVGGSAMRAEGLVGDIDMEALTVFGFGAALAAYPRLSRLADRLVADIVKARPRLVVTVDVKGFSLRLAKRLKRRMSQLGWSAPVVHCVAPTVWAWGEWRRHRVARSVDGLLCLFPFEPAYFEPLGVKAHFIGHPEAFNPIYDRLPAPRSGAPLHLTLLPGSRHSEIRHLLAPMLEAFKLVRAMRPGITATIPTLPRLAPQIAASCERHGLEQLVSVDQTDGSLFSSLDRSQAALAASGTVTLQTALYGVPGVACYGAPPLSAFIGRRLVRMDRVVLPNALLGREVYPFLFQEAATPQAMADGILAVVADGDAKTRARASARELRDLLRGGAISFEDRIAAAMADWFGRDSG
ncbi:MAG: lipid-A-disaccharide synthase [Candidatus Puniceispirillaceae bacterium]